MDKSKAADEASNLSVEKLRYVLEQVTDYRKPESEKCPLARQLKREAEVDDHSLKPHVSPSASATSSNSLSTSGCIEDSSVTTTTTSKSKNSNNNSATTLTVCECSSGGGEEEGGHQVDECSVQSSKSLQNLDSFCRSYFTEEQDNMRAVGVSRKGNHKAMHSQARANSFTVTASANASGASGSGMLCKQRSESEAEGTCSSPSSSPNSSRGKVNKNSRSKSEKQSSSPSTSSSSSQNSGESGGADVIAATAAALVNHICQDKSCDNESAVSEEHLQTGEDECPTEIEMEELGKKAAIVEYSSSKGLLKCCAGGGGGQVETSTGKVNPLGAKRQANCTNVDTLINMDMLKTQDGVQTQYAQRVVNNNALSSNEVKPEDVKAVQPASFIMPGNFFCLICQLKD